MARLQLKVSPKASRDAVLGWHGGRLKLAVTAAPDKGKANAAVLKLLARALDLRRAELELVAGHASSEKTVEVALEAAEIRARLGALAGAGVDSATGRRPRK